MLDPRTPNLNLPKPHERNDLADDVLRLGQAVDMLDGHVAGLKDAVEAGLAATAEGLTEIGERLAEVGKRLTETGERLAQDTVAEETARKTSDAALSERIDREAAAREEHTLATGNVHDLDLSPLVPKATRIIADGLLEGGGPLNGDVTVSLDAGKIPRPLEGIREVFAGTIQAWPSLCIPTLEDGLPLGLSLDGAVADLSVYPRLARVLCPAADNAWAPAWFRCDGYGTRGEGEGFHHIRLDDWRGGHPRALDLGRGIDRSTALVKTTNGSADITIVNNLSAGGTLLTPSTGTEGFYPGIGIAGAGIPAGAVITAVSGVNVTLSIACTATAASVEITLTGRVPGSWQGDTTRPAKGTTSLYGFYSGSAGGVLYNNYSTYVSGGAFAKGSCVVGQDTFDISRTAPVAPCVRPAGPAAHYIILV